MSNAIANVSAALGYDAVETMLASGRSLADCYRFAAVAGDNVSCDEVCPVSCDTVLADSSATVRPGSR